MSSFKSFEDLYLYLQNYLFQKPNRTLKQEKNLFALNIFDSRFLHLSFWQMLLEQRTLEITRCTWEEEFVTQNQYLMKKISKKQKFITLNIPKEK